LPDDLALIEYLIRTTDGHEPPGVHRDRLADALVPPGFGCQAIEGWGDFRMRCRAAEVSFSMEPPGWQVTIEGPMAEPDGDQLVGAIAEQLGRFCGEPCEWLGFGVSA
jgi:hypothetical protein